MQGMWSVCVVVWGSQKRWKMEISRPSQDRKSTRLNSSHLVISYAVFCLKKKKKYCIAQSRPHSSSSMIYGSTHLSVLARLFCLYYFTDYFGSTIRSHAHVPRMFACSPPE